MQQVEEATLHVEYVEDIVEISQVEYVEKSLGLPRWSVSERSSRRSFARRSASE